MTDPLEGRPTGRGSATVVETFTAWPRWARIAAPVGAGVLVLGGIGSVAGAGDGDGDREAIAAAAAEDRTPVTFAPLEEALEVAADLAPDGLSTWELERLIEATCDGLADGGGDDQAARVQARIAAAVPDAASFTDALAAAGAGAELLCPDDVARRPSFLRAVASATTTSTTSAPTTTDATVAPATTAPPATAPPATVPPATVPPATVPPTTQAQTVAPPPPPPPPPPTTAAPPPPTQPSVYYANCAAARAAGAAPVYRGQPGYAPHLDRDGDGIGCE